jgi:hypothetical protein
VAKSGIPDPLERRLLVERSLSQERALRLAEAYLEVGRVWEAIAFLERAEARDRLQGLRDEAVAAGDSFLVRELSRALGEDPTPARWRETEAAAATAGKERYAAEARRQAERGDG